MWLQKHSTQKPHLWLLHTWKESPQKERWVRIGGAWWEYTDAIFVSGGWWWCVCRGGGASGSHQARTAQLNICRLAYREFGPPTNMTLSWSLYMSLLHTGGANTSLFSSYQPCSHPQLQQKQHEHTAVPRTRQAG